MNTPARHCLTVALVLCASAAMAAPQSNVVKTGVDAWSHGDYKQAIKDWQGPADKGDADAQFNLGQAYKLGRGVSTDMAKAQEWYRKAAVQGHPQAQDNYGLLLFQSGHQSDAVPWLQKSAQRGEPRAELVLGTILFNGDAGQAKDWPRAYALMVRASDSGLPQASQTLGDMDRYIPLDQRKQGLALASQYRADAQHTSSPPEIASAGSTQAIRPVPVPPSSAAQVAPMRDTRSAPPGASYPQPGMSPHAPAVAPPTANPPMHHAEPAAAKPAPAPAARTASAQAPRTGGGWRVQLGAFSSEANARHLWESLNPRVPSLRGGQPYLVHAGAVTRLQAGSFASSADAARACTEVKRAGNACLPVAP